MAAPTLPEQRSVVIVFGQAQFDTLRRRAEVAGLTVADFCFALIEHKPLPKDKTAMDSAEKANAAADFAKARWVEEAERARVSAAMVVTLTKEVRDLEADRAQLEQALEQRAAGPRIPVTPAVATFVPLGPHRK